MLIGTIAFRTTTAGLFHAGIGRLPLVFLSLDLHKWGSTFVSLAVKVGLLLETAAALLARNACLESLLLAAIAAVLTGVLIGSRRLLGRARREIVELRRQLTDAESRYATSERGNVAKGEFLANMSAEMQAPMNGILSFAEMALKTDLTPLQHSYLDRVMNSAQWLMHVLSDVFDFSRIESARLEFDEGDFSFSACVLSAVKIVEPSAAKKHLDLRSKIGPDIPPVLRGDVGRVRQIIVNLLENAVRYTTAGSIVLSASVVERSGDLTTLEVVVADTGIGIPSDRQQIIFEPFMGGTHVSLDREGGTGLGLCICKNLIEMMGGKIEVQSHVGAGSTFRFTVKLRNPILLLDEGEEGEILSKLSSKRISILVADESAINRRMAAKLFESAGHHVALVPNGKQALDTFCTDIFDLVLLSPLLPDLDATTMVHDLRNLEAEATRTQIYCFRPETADCALPSPALVDGFVSKPAQIEELLRLLNQAAAARAVLELSR